MDTKFALILWCTCQLSFSCNVTRDEIDLHTNLFNRYNPDVIPRLNTSKPIAAEIEFYLKAIENVDVKRQTLTVRAFLSVVWEDDLLKWDTKVYPGVTNINVKNEAIWLPDLSLAGSQDHILDIGQKGGRAMVTSKGTVTMWPYKLYTVACKINIVQFPLDEQNCVLSFSSWTHPTTVIRLRNPSGRIDLNRRFSKSGEWTVTSLETRLWESTFELSRFDHVDFILRVRRKCLFHVLNTVMPTVCISLLNILCFLLPVQSGERVTLSISIFLSLAVFLTVINDSMPESSDEVAIFNIYVCLQLLGGALTNAMTVSSLYYFHNQRKDAKMPFPFRFLVKAFSMQPFKGAGDGAEGFAIRRGNKVGIEARSESMATSALVSQAVDRACLVCAICWHIIVNLYLIIGIVI